MLGQLASAHQVRIGLIKKPAQTQHGVRMAETHHSKSDTSPTCVN
jgi:hypothetical protein